MNSTHYVPAQYLHAFREQCSVLVSQTHSRCGLIYELYQRRVSVSIADCLDAIPAEYREQTVELARREFDVMMNEEMEEEIQKDSARSLSSGY